MAIPIKVQILNDGLHAKEVNHVINPKIGVRTFTIESELITVLKKMSDKVAEMYGETGAVIVHNNDASLIPGSIHEAEILSNGKIKIIQ